MHLDFPQVTTVKVYKEYLNIKEALVAWGQYEDIIN